MSLLLVMASLASASAFAAPADQETLSPAVIRWQSLACQYDDWDCLGVLRVIACESSGDPNAYDGYNIGLLQVATAYHQRRLQPGESLFDPEVNIRIGHDIFIEQGWLPAWPYCGKFGGR